MRHAIVQARTAAEKAGKTSRLLAEAAGHFTNYINIIAPGTVPDRVSAPEATPAGERLTSEAERSTASSFYKSALKKADDIKDVVSSTTKSLTEGAKSVSRPIKMEPPISPSEVSTGTAAAPQSFIRSVHQHSASVHDSVSAVTIGLIGIVLTGMKLQESVRKRRASGNENQE